MEFEDEDDYDEEEEEEEEDDDGKGITIPPPARPISVTTADPATGASSSVGAPQPHTSSGGNRHRECQKNHAVSIGGHAVDGCGEFMPASDDGTLDALKCAACGCHRNFHRKETDFSSSATTSPPGAAGTALQYPLPPQYPPHLPYYRGPPPAYIHHHQHHPRPLALPSTTAHEMEELSNPSSSGGGSGGKKRHRTKFTAEQKERMVEFAESVGWRIQKQDEAAVEQFCRELHVSRQVLKVWLHNNKHTLGRKP